MYGQKPSLRKRVNLSGDLESKLSVSSLFVISFNGIVTSTATVQASHAIEAALNTRLSLEENYDKDDRTWLLNKIKALFHVTQINNKLCMYCTHCNKHRTGFYNGYPSCRVDTS